MHILETITSAFRGRPVSFAQLQARTSVQKEDRTANRWTLFKQLCIAKSVFGVNDRCLAVLNALLSFYPDNEIGRKHGLVVFPSNRQLALRAHGMPESTLRRHLSVLIAAGLIARRDSPNGKRYSYKDRAGQVEEAFGFSFAPLLERAEEIEHAAEKIQNDRLQLKRKREQITLIRREIVQLIETVCNEHACAQLEEASNRFAAISSDMPRRAGIDELDQIFSAFAEIHNDLVNLLKSFDNTEKMSGSDAQNERHYKESLTESFIESSNLKSFDLKASYPATTGPCDQPDQPVRVAPVSLDLVLRCCPAIRDYAQSGISTWRDLLDASRTVALFLGITDTAYRDATFVMGREGVSAVIAWLLQRIDRISSAGGYLRSLTQKAREGNLSIGKLLTVPGVAGPA
jgi:replication initiation protein RepC